MKTLKCVLMVAIIIAFFGNLNLKAQLGPPCEFPCEDSTLWIHHEQHEVWDYGNCPSCAFHVTYDEEAVICDTIVHYNVYVTKISWEPSCNICYPSGPDKLFACYNRIMEWYYTMMQHSRVIVTFSHIACMTQCAPAASMMEACEGSTGCCTSTFTIDYINGEHVCTEALYYVPQGTCPSGCQLTCETQWYQKSTIERKYELTRPEIIPNPAKDLLNISFDSDYKGSVKIDVYNLKSDLVLSYKRDKSNNSFQTPIDISSLESGSYIIYIYINDSQMIWSNKFIKEK